MAHKKKKRKKKKSFMQEVRDIYNLKWLKERIRGRKWRGLSSKVVRRHKRPLRSLESSIRGHYKKDGREDKDKW